MCAKNTHNQVGRQSQCFLVSLGFLASKLGHEFVGGGTLGGSGVVDPGSSGLSRRWRLAQQVFAAAAGTAGLQIISLGRRRRVLPRLLWTGAGTATA